MELYLYDGQKRIGPYSEANIRDMLATGTIDSTSPVWHEGMIDWKPLKEIISLDADPSITLRPRVVIASPLRPTVSVRNARSKFALLLFLTLACFSLLGGAIFLLRYQSSRKITATSALGQAPPNRTPTTSASSYLRSGTSHLVSRGIQYGTSPITDADLVFPPTITSSILGFHTESDLEANFTTKGNGGNFSFAPAGGIQAGGLAVAHVNTSDTLFTNLLYRNKVGASFRTSAIWFFDEEQRDPFNNHVCLRIGFNSVNSALIKCDFSILSNSHSFIWIFHSPSSSTSRPIPPISSSHWYRTTVILKNTGGQYDRFDVKCFTEDCGSTGNEKPVLMPQLTYVNSFGSPKLSEVLSFQGNLYANGFGGCSFIDSYLLSGMEQTSDGSLMTMAAITPTQKLTPQNAESVAMATPLAPPPPKAQPKAKQLFEERATPVPTITHAIEQAPRIRELRAIQLPKNWASALSTASGGGSMTIADLNKILNGFGHASNDMAPSEPFQIFEGVTYLMPLREAEKLLKLPNAIKSKVKVACPGLPDGLYYYSYDGYFEGTYNRLYLVTDYTDQVVCTQIVEESPEKGKITQVLSSRSRLNGSNNRASVSRTNNNHDYHTYNFINTRTKAKDTLRIQSHVKNEGSCVRVELSLYDPELNKVLEKSVWNVPNQLVNLILFCVDKRDQQN